LSTYVRRLRTDPDATETLGSALFGKTRRRLLGWLFTHPDQAFYVRELVKSTGVAQGAISRDLRALTEAGLLRRTVRGREVFFQADESSPVFPELKSFFAKTTGLASQIRTALHPLESRIRLALVHGSAARGELRAGSDVDLLVVGSVRFGEVVDHLHEAQRALGREINPAVYSSRELRDKLDAGDHFITTVLREPHFFLLGGPSELERVGQERLADGTSDQRPGNHKSVRHRRAGAPRQCRRKRQS